MSNKLSIGLVQHACTEDHEQNLFSSIAGIRKAANQGARLIVLPELHGNIYFCQNEDPKYFALAESIPGPTTTILGRLAAELGVVVVASVFECCSSGLYYNTCVTLEANGTMAGTYRKMHIPYGPGYFEKYYFTPGDQGFVPITTSVGRLGILICWDQWFPEAARLMALAGADILLYPTAIGWDTDWSGLYRDDTDEQARQLDAWMTIQRSHAIANGLPVVCCNRTGLEHDPSGRTRGIRFWGNSFAAGPQGEILTAAPDHEPATLVTPIDLGRTEYIRRIWPLLHDRRVDAYQGLSQK